MKRKDRIEEKYLFLKQVSKDPKLLRYKLTQLRQHIRGFAWGMCDGAITGLRIAQKRGYNGTWFLGDILHSISIIMSSAIGILHGSVIGLLTNEDHIAETLKQYRCTFEK